MYFFGRDFFNARVGAIAAIVLATSFRVMWESRWAHVDMVFGFFPLTCALLWRAGAFAPRRAQGNLARIKGSSLNLYFNRRDLRREPLV
jgi:4-amino-4-deoxy-L-arabinose transferase-like glycosyltransferase